MKTLTAFLVLTISLLAQEYKVVQVKGDVKYQSGTSEEWLKVTEGTTLGANDFISTGEKSSVQLKSSEHSLALSDMSVLSIGSIKTMTTDELLLALAMEDMINAPKNNRKGNSNNTAAYGTQENGEKKTEILPDNFGIKRLNGAMQLAKSGLKESSVVFAKETYRKYPDSKQLPAYRIFFADILYEKGLYEEALSEYFAIQQLELSDTQSKEVISSVDKIKKILLSK